MSSRRAFLRAAVLLTASLLTGAERSGYLWHYEGNLQRTVGWQHDEAPVCPSEAPGPLRLKFPSVSCNMETILCRPLGLIYLHVYKSAGTSFMEMLDRFCEEATGNKTEKIAGYDRKTWVKYRLNNVGLPRLGSACDPELICSSPGWTCYASTRDPVERFLSAYHEVAKRRESNVVKSIIKPPLPETVDRETKLAMFDKFLVVAQRGPGFDAHIGPQSWFLPKNESNVRIFKAEDGERPVQDFLCAMLECFNRKRGIGESNETDSLAPSNCPRIPLSVLRDRRDPTYRLPQYDISLDMLSLDTIKRITAIFKKDFCRFGYRTKRGVDPIVCDDETTSTASTTATSITTTTTDAATPTMMGYTIGPSMTSAAGDLVSQDASLRINSWTGMGVGGPP